MSRHSTCSTPMASGNRPPRQRPHDERRQLGHVVGEVVREEPAHVGERGPAVHHRRHDGGEVVVEQHQVGGLAGHVGARRAHGHADVGLLQGRPVVHAVAGHGQHVAARPAGHRAMRSLSSGTTRATTTPSRSTSSPSTGRPSGSSAPRPASGAGERQPDLGGDRPRPWPGWSPVTMATRMPAARQAAMASAASARGGSWRPSTAEQLEVGLGRRRRSPRARRPPSTVGRRRPARRSPRAANASHARRRPRAARPARGRAPRRARPSPAPRRSVTTDMRRRRGSNGKRADVGGATSSATPSRQGQRVDGRLHRVALGAPAPAPWPRPGRSSTPGRRAAARASSGDGRRACPSTVAPSGR